MTLAKPRVDRVPLFGDRRELFELGTLVDNNTTVDAAAMVVALPDRPNLQIAAIDAPDSLLAGSTASLQFEVINQGTAPANGRQREERPERLGKAKTATRRRAFARRLARS